MIPPLPPADPGRSSAVLIGVSAYAHLPELPAVRTNLVDLQHQLQDPAVWGLPPERCHRVPDPAGASEAIGPLRRAAEEATDTLVVYFAGHGLVDPDRGDLWLALSGTRPGEIDTVMPYDWVRRELLRSRAERILVILDCCYSGRALGMMGGAQATAELANGADAAGTYLIASASETSQALAPPGARNTAFTGELLSLLANGLPGGPELLRPDDLYAQLAAALRARSWPAPQARVRNTAGRLPLFRNRAHVPADLAEQPIAHRYRGLGEALFVDEDAVTLAAHDTLLDRQVGIRLMRPEAASDPVQRDAFAAALRARARLTHPYLAVVLDLGETEVHGVRCPYAATQGLQGVGLDSWIPGPHDVARTVRACSDILEALEEAHHNGLSGWYLAPARVRIVAGHVKIVDCRADAFTTASVARDLRAVAACAHALLTGASGPPERRGAALEFPAGTPDHLAAVLRFAWADGFAGAAAMRHALDPAVPVPTPAPGPVPPPRQTVVPPRPTVPPSTGLLSLRFSAGSHRGFIREVNEDSGYAGPRLLAVADGMGGQAAGEVASSEVISSLVQLDDDVPGSDILTALGTAVQRANDQLRVMVEEDPQLEGMGTTLTALLWTGRRLGLVHVGDSRAYLLRDGVLTQITQDHTWVQRLVDEGRITEEEARIHPQRSLLMRALGAGKQVEPDLSIREVRTGDRYLLCSDGLSGVVPHQTLEETLDGHRTPDEAVQDLIRLALRGGGPDNVTCIVADVIDIGTVSPPSPYPPDMPVVVGAVAENQPPADGLPYIVPDHRR
ncbi:protein phosphatase 2C domain-containing protein [Streptomyces sp. NPDC101118]|uniref:caspase, EACC1-associated type n=1 Tax=Streptomyces sp. NPDC101118 TaxID=3366109 RepID=UPI00380D5DFD